MAAAVVFVALLTGLTASTAPVSAAAPPGFVHRSGRHFVDGQNRPIRLNGVNLGQWLLWEQREMGVGYSGSDETDLMNRLTTLVGGPRALQFQKDLRDNYVNLDDFRSIAALGYNVARVSFNHTVLEDDSAPGVFKPEGWARFDQMLDWAEQTNVYLVLDLHAAPCGQSTWFIADPDPVTLWDDATCRTRTVELWRAIANRYANRTIVAGYDLLNEPEKRGDGSALRNLYADIISAIRSVDTNHLVFLEGAWGASDFSMFTSRLDENMAYSYHQYLWASWDAAGDTRRYKALADRDNVPLWLGEFGQDSTASVASQVSAANADPGIDGWAVWSWKAAAGGTTATFNGVPMTSAWLKLLKWMDNPTGNPQPTNAEAETGMGDYINNMKLANTVRDNAFARVVAPKSTTIKFTASSGKCADDLFGWSVNGMPIILNDCNGTANQVWSRGVASTTPFMTLGKCLSIAGAGSSNGTRVVLYDCNGGDAQQWTIFGDGTIRARGKCLDLPGAWTINFNWLQIYDCNGAPSQRWTVT